MKNSLLPSITQSLIEILNEIANYYTLTKKYSEKLNLVEEKDKLRKFLDSFSRNISWFIGMTAYKLIKVKEVEKD